MLTVVVRVSSGGDKRRRGVLRAAFARRLLAPFVRVKVGESSGAITFCVYFLESFTCFPVSREFRAAEGYGVRRGLRRAQVGARPST
jgi:hypothetical protein